MKKTLSSPNGNQTIQVLNITQPAQVQVKANKYCWVTSSFLLLDVS